MKKEIEPLPLIATAIGTVIATVAVLGYYGYLHFAKPDDALELQTFTMMKTVPGVNHRIRAEKPDQIADCIDGIIVLFDKQPGLTGVLVDSKDRAIRCDFVSANPVQKAEIQANELAPSEPALNQTTAPQPDQAPVEN